MSIGLLSIDYYHPYVLWLFLIPYAFALVVAEGDVKCSSVFWMHEDCICLYVKVVINACF